MPEVYGKRTSSHFYKHCVIRKTKDIKSPLIETSPPPLTHKRMQNNQHYLIETKTRAPAMLVSNYSDRQFSAAMLANKGLVAVALQMNLRILLHVADKAHKSWDPF